MGLPIAAERAEQPAGDEHPQHAIELLARLDEAGEQGPRTGDELCEYLSGRPAVPHWFTLDEDRPLFAFAGLWRLWTGTRGKMGFR